MWFHPMSHGYIPPFFQRVFQGRKGDASKANLGKLQPTKCHRTNPLQVGEDMKKRILPLKVEGMEPKDPVVNYHFFFSYS